MNKKDKFLMIIFIIFTIYIIVVYQQSFVKSYKVYNYRMNDSNDIKKYVLEKSKLNNSGYSTHFWYKDLPKNIKNNLHNICEDIKLQISDIQKIDPKYIITINEMSEVAITGTKKSNSEKIFFQRHYDGPFLLYPCKIDRIIIALQGKDSTTTHFDDNSISLKTNEGMLFDYDRSPHFITINKNKDTSEKRILLKIHFYIYKPTFFEPFLRKNICIQPHINYAYYSRNDLDKNKNINGIRSKLILIFGYLFTNFKIIVFISYIFFLLYLYNRKNIFLYLTLVFIFIQILFFLSSVYFIFIHK
jgi:hypothetical protein